MRQNRTEGKNFKFLFPCCILKELANRRPFKLKQVKQE